MSAYFEIAYAAATKRLCLFTGTGFSKAITENAAPGWQELLELLCEELSDPAAIKNVLFPVGGKNLLSLEESAQVVDIELSKLGKDIYGLIAQKIGAINLSGDNTVISEFFTKNAITLITTNFDKLAEELAGAGNCQSITPGFPVPRSPSRVKVYHVHGSIDSPQNMVVTSDDYFRFINGHSYFSRKLSTILHENTVVILGYSLGDTNLKAIINDYRSFSKTHIISGNLFFVSRSRVDQYIKDYYAHCYGIRVLDTLEVHEFFKRINISMPEATKCVVSSIEDIKKVLFKGNTFTDHYLKVSSSFYEIVASVAAIGRSINDPRVVTALEAILSKKVQFTNENGAWEQYEHLAQWLIYLGSILELNGTSIRDTYLGAVLRSMTTMSNTQYYGYSWHAYTSWSYGWSKIIASNRGIIKAFIKARTVSADALEIVNRG